MKKIIVIYEMGLKVSNKYAKEYMTYYNEVISDALNTKGDTIYDAGVWSVYTYEN